MASITFNSLKDNSKSQDKYTYVDFHLDFEENLVGPQSTFIETVGTGRDIKAAFDLNAIRNSLKNLFNTKRGERYLLPEYGADIREYIFEPITERTGELIGRGIRGSIEQWEPRVSLLSIDIVGIRDNHEYRITMALAIPFLTEPLNLPLIFTREGFIV